GGGRRGAARARATRLDGWHGSRLSPEEAEPIVRQLRARRPDPDFAVSLRHGWNGKDDAALGARLAAYAEAGIDHILVEPAERALDDWLRAVGWVARAAEGIQPWNWPSRCNYRWVRASTWTASGKLNGSAMTRCGAARPTAPTQ